MDDLSVEDACADLKFLEELSQNDKKTRKVLDDLIELINAERYSAEQRQAKTE